MFWSRRDVHCSLQWSIDARRDQTVFKMNCMQYSTVQYSRICMDGMRSIWKIHLKWAESNYFLAPELLKPYYFPLRVDECQELGLSTEGVGWDVEQAHLLLDQRRRDAPENRRDQSYVMNSVRSKNTEVPRFLKMSKLWNKNHKRGWVCIIIDCLDPIWRTLLFNIIIIETNAQHKAEKDSF